MTFRYVDTTILSDIANAVRERNGKSCAYKPRELPQAVSELDGTSQGATAVMQYSGMEHGLVQDSVFKGIANTLRLHTMGKRKYKPREMAAAIRRLDFEEGEKPRALLHESGVLEFNLHSTRSTDLDADVSEIYPVSLNGYDDVLDVPWLEAADEITSVDFRPSFQLAFISDMNHWFSGCMNLIEVKGFDYVAGSLSAVDAMFAGCRQLDTISCEWTVAQRTRAGLPFEGCLKLVGQNLAMPTDESTGDLLHSGSGGLIVRKTSDQRRFFMANLYAGGTLTFTASKPTKQYNCIRSGRLCKGVAYRSAEALPYHGYKDRVLSVQFKQQMGFYAGTPMDWWFAGCNNIRGFTGLENMAATPSMRHAFDGCDRLTRIELVGFDPSSLRNVEDCFSGCEKLRTIVVDPTWELPSACVGDGAFDGCALLVGGNGTGWDEDASGASMMRIDAEGTPGYLTAN